MGPVNLGSTPSDPAGQIKWIINSLRAIESASQQDPIRIFDSYSSDAAATVTRVLAVASPTSANLAAVLSTLLADMQKRGVNRVQPT